MANYISESVFNYMVILLSIITFIKQTKVIFIFNLKIIIENKKVI